MAAELLGHTEWVRALARVVARDAASADDLTQETFAAALVGAPPSGPALRTWLAGTVRNLARLGFRGDAHRSEREREAARSERAGDHARILAEAEAHRAVVDHVLALDDRDRELILARYFEGRSPAEIARRDGRTAAAVSSQLTRAHRSLRARLEAEGGSDRWLAGIAPLLVRVGAPSKAASTGVMAFASAWTLVAAVIVVGLAALWLLGGPGPGGGPVDLVPADVEEADRGGATPDVVLADAEQGVRTGEVAAAPVAVSQPGGLAATVVASDGSQLVDAHLWVEDVMGDPMGDAPLGSEGQAVLGQIPSARPMRAFLSLGGERWPDPIAEFELLAGERAKPTWTVFLKTQVTLIARDESGQIAAGQTLGITRSSTRRREFSHDMRKKSLVAAIRGNAKGAALFADVSPGLYGAGVIDYTITREEIGPDGMRTLHVGAGPTNPGCAVTIPIEIPPNTESMTVEVPVYRGQRIKGRVVDQDGNALEGVELLASMPGVGGALGATSDEQGRFSFGSVMEGQYTVHSDYSWDGWVLAEQVEVESGMEDLLLKLGRAGEVDLTLIGPDTQDVWVWRARIGPGSRGASGSGPYDLEGGRKDVSLGGLQPGVHWISAHDEGGTRLGVAFPVHVAPGPERTACTIDLTRALEVEVSNRDPKRYVISRPKMESFLLPGGYAAAGESNVVAVPPGTSTLMLRLEGGTWESHTVTGAAGERVTIEVGGD